MAAHNEVSPTSIRSRILKERFHRCRILKLESFTHVDPFEDTESRACSNGCGGY